jgi:endonuclease/exonuclease/phosphatase family metal-dependent hydrolase
VRVVTWNVWWRFGPQWRARQPLIAATLARLDPDVVALQEAWAVGAESQADQLAARLGLHAISVETSMPPVPEPPENDDQAGVSVTIALLSRWPVRRYRVEHLPAAHRPPPACIVAHLNHPDGPLRVLTTCTEWEPRFVEDQRNQMRALRSLCSDADLDGELPLVLAGDLNVPPDSTLLSPLLAVMDDAWALGEGDPDAASLDSRHPYAPDVPHLIDRRIDHVLVRPGRVGRRVQVSKAFLAGDAVDGLDPSDHKAVVCDLSW